MATKKQLDALKKARAAKAKKATKTTKKATPAKKTTAKRTGKMSGTEKVKKTQYMQWYDYDFRDWGSFSCDLFKLYHTADGVNREKLRKAFPDLIGTKEQLKANYPI